MTAAAGDSGKREAVIYRGRDLDGIREAAAAAATALARIAALLRPGMSTLMLDQLAGETICRLGGQSAFFRYRDYPGQICISLNDEVVHGIGRPDRLIRPGDLVSLDVGVRYGGFIGDCATTVAVGGAPSPLAKRLLEVTHDSLLRGLAAARAGEDVNVIGRTVESVVKAAGFAVVRDYVGHGVGRELHEPPEVPNFALHSRGPRLKPGMVLAVEPMVNTGTYRVTTDRSDNWTVRTADGGLSAHFEHMILITEREAEILTCPRKP